MAPYNAPQRAAITQFANVTGASQSVAAKYLRNFRWNLNAAVDSYLAAASPAATVDTAALNRVFDNYRDDPKNEPNEIGIEGAMLYLEAIEVPLDEVICLGIAELLKSETIGKFKRDDFIGGWSSKG
ncbi:Scaffold-type E3 ligase, partial [Ascosphaera atra]